VLHDSWTLSHVIGAALWLNSKAFGDASMDEGRHQLLFHAFL
jgi:hypothetical protein